MGVYLCVCPVCLTQGLVNTLHEGDDFGQLALVNDAPRAATIIVREDNCHFLRVNKQDFIRILKVNNKSTNCSAKCLQWLSCSLFLNKDNNLIVGCGGKHNAFGGTREGCPCPWKKLKPSDTPGRMQQQVSKTLLCPYLLFCMSKMFINKKKIKIQVSSYVLL